MPRKQPQEIQVRQVQQVDATKPHLVAVEAAEWRARPGALAVELRLLDGIHQGLGVLAALPQPMRGNVAWQLFEAAGIEIGGAVNVKRLVGAVVLARFVSLEDGLRPIAFERNGSDV